MNSERISGIRLRGFAFTGALLSHMVLAYLGLKLVLIFAMLPLADFIPAALGRLLTLLPEIAVAAIIVIWLLARACQVELTPERAVVRWRGLALRAIPADKVKLVCAVGNDREDMLCLSGLTVEEMAARMEKRLMRSGIKKHDVPMRKRNPDWQADFAREYLNCLRARPIALLMERHVIMLDMDPALQYRLTRMYDHAPYRNLTEITSPYAKNHGGIEGDRALRFSMMAYCDYRFVMEPDGIHISEKNREKMFIPASKLRSAVRIDVFHGYDQYWPHHVPLMFISGLTEDQLAARAPESAVALIGDDGAEARALLTMAGALDRAQRWDIDTKDCLTVPFTEKNLNDLRAMYPHITTDCVSTKWQQNT